MVAKFWFKGLSAEDHHFGHTPAKSAALAKGTLYEAWFDTLKASPWYRDISTTGIFLSEAAEENWKNFGDLRELKFEPWWRAKGYKLFAEKVPFRGVKEIKLKHRVDIPVDAVKPPVLILEIPLNLSPKYLEAQVRKVLLAHKNYASDFNRWEHSTARLHQERETKMTYSSINSWLKIYKSWIDANLANPDLTQYEFSRDMNINPNLARNYGRDFLHNPEERAMFANALSQYLKPARKLMANATEGKFPSTEDHEWATGSQRNKPGSDVDPLFAQKNIQDWQ